MKKTRGLKFLIFLLVVSFIFISINLVSAESIFQNLVGSSDFNFPAISFGDSIWFSKLLLFFLVALIIFGISDALPFLGKPPKKDFIAIGLAIVVGILSVFYLDNTQVYSILLSYNVLGVTLSVIVPFVIIMALSYKLYRGGYAAFSGIVWIVFGVVLVVRWLSADVSEIGAFGAWAYPITLILVLIFLFFQRRIYARFVRSDQAAKIDRYLGMKELGRISDRERARDIDDRLG